VNEGGEMVILTLALPNPPAAYQIGESNSAFGFVVEKPPFPGAAPLEDGQLADQMLSVASVVSTPPLSAYIHAFALLPSGACQLTVFGPGGKTVTIEVSQDLEEWQPLATLENKNGVIEFVDPTASNFGQSFYRVVQEP
jgi:hypothetical protein